MELYVDSPNMSVDEETNTITVNPIHNWEQADIILTPDEGELSFSETTNNVYQKLDDSYQEHSNTFVDISAYQSSSQVDIYLSESAGGQYKITSSFDDGITQYEGELEFTIAVYDGPGAGEPAGGDDEEEEDPYGFSHLLISYDGERTASETFFTKGYLTPGDTIGYGVVAYYNNGETIPITSDNLIWTVDTVEGELAADTSIGQDGLLSVSDTQADLSVLRVQAIFTDSDEVEHTESQEILVSEEDIILSVSIDEEEPYYTDEWYSITTTAQNVSGETVPMVWRIDMAPAVEDEPLYTYFDETGFSAENAGEYYLRAWGEYLLSQYAEIPVTVVQNPNSGGGDWYEPTFSFWINASPGGYTPGLSTNNITLSANVSFGEETLDAAYVMNWNLVNGSVESGTTLTNNGDGTANLYISPDETERLIVTAEYEYDGTIHTAECVIVNHPPVGTMLICDENGQHNAVTYTKGIQNDIQLTAYAFSEYTGSVQPLENAYTGNDAAVIASHLNFYLVEDYYEDSQTPISIEGVSLSQTGDKVTVHIDETVTSAFDVVCHLDSGMLVSISVKPEE